MTSKNTLANLQRRIQHFIRERDWEQFHSPKNISMSLAIEAAELMEHFQWHNTADESVKVLKDKQKRSDIEDEIADVAMYLLDFCNMYDVDLEKAVLKKLKKNIKKYPAKLVKGRTDKYTFYQKNK